MVEGAREPEASSAYAAGVFGEVSARGSAIHGGPPSLEILADDKVEEVEWFDQERKAFAA